MKYFKCLVVILCATGSASAFADYKRVYDRTSQRAEEVCKVNADGNYEIAVACNAGLYSPFSTREIRNPSATIDIITPPIEQTYPVGAFDHAIIYVHYGMANGQSLIQIIDPSDKTDHKYSKGSSWLVDTSAIDIQVDKIEGLKKGDLLCLKEDHGKYSAGHEVRILGIFEKEQMANIHVEKSFLGRFFDLNINEPTHLVNLSKLVSCSSKPSLDPGKAVQTSAPALNVDVKVNNQQSPKEISAPTTSSQTATAIAQ